MILSLATLEECQDARTILVEKHNAAQAEYGKYLTNKNLARKGNSIFRYEKELADAEEYLASIIEALAFVKRRVHDIKFAGTSEGAFIMRAIQEVFGDEGKLQVLNAMNRIREEARHKAVQRPGLALEPTGNAGQMKIRYV
jgi:predicted house-cleaning noncanonical NTP pyrophosphatase (MazG superfamily)